MEPSNHSRYESEKASLSVSAARKRLAMLFDGGTYEELNRFLKNKEQECEVVTAVGLIGGSYVYAFAQSVDVNGGAMGSVQASKIAHIFELAATTGYPVVGIYDSNGAHIDEGVGALEAYGKLISLSSKLSGVVPQISIIAGSCIGSAAVMATLSDFTVMTKDSEFYVTAPSVIGGKEDLGTANTAYKNGTAALVAKDDEEAISKVAELLSYLPSNNLSVAMMAECESTSGHDELLADIFDDNSFVELYADFGKCIKVGFARLCGASVGVVFTDKTVADGYFCDDGARKAAKFIRICDAYSLPIITLVDSYGIVSSEESELSGGVKSVALLTGAYSEATCPKISVVAGNAYSAAYIAFVSAASAPDMVFAFEDSAIGALEPMTAVQLLYKDRLLAGETREDLEKEYISEKCSPFSAAAKGYLTDIITKQEAILKISSAIDVLSSKRASTMNKKHTNIPL